jgi:glucose-1-phosphate cytidylyltransferase
MVNSFLEKPQGQGTWINGGFFVLEPSVIDLIADDTVVWEKQPLEDLAAQKQLHAYKHEGFWQCMDTVRDKLLLESLWESGSAPWKSWK